MDGRQNDVQGGQKEHKTGKSSKELAELAVKQRGNGEKDQNEQEWPERAETARNSQNTPEQQEHARTRPNSRRGRLPGCNIASQHGITTSYRSILAVTAYPGILHPDYSGIVCVLARYQIPVYSRVLSRAATSSSRPCWSLNRGRLPCRRDSNSDHSGSNWPVRYS